MKKVKLISLEDTGNNIFVWIEERRAYVSYEVSQDKIIETERHPKREFVNYQHFVGVMSKFNPYTFFLEKPVRIPFTFDALRAEADRRRQAQNQNQQGVDYEG